MARLVCIRGEHEGSSFPIDRGVTLGRATHNQIVLAKTRGASRDHAKVWKLGARQYAVADVGSTNGTLVNDAREDRANLSDGDTIQVGDASFRFEFDDADKPAIAKTKPDAASGRGAGRQDAASLFGTPSTDKEDGAAAPMPQIEIKERVLQYSKKSGGGSQVGWDMSQTAGLQRWALLALLLGAFVGLFILARSLMG